MNDMVAISRAIGQLEGEMRSMRTNVENVDKKLDTVILQTTTLRAERAADRKRHTRMIALVSSIGTFAGALFAKFSGHV